jgi:hypothetical protein
MHGAFTPIAHDRTKTAVDGPAYISFPGNAPPHALKCGAEGLCIVYLRYAWLFDIKYPSEGSKVECCARRRETRMSNRAPSLDGLRRHSKHRRALRSLAVSLPSTTLWTR